MRVKSLSVLNGAPCHLDYMSTCISDTSIVLAQFNKDNGGEKQKFPSLK